MVDPVVVGELVELLDDIVAVAVLDVAKLDTVRVELEVVSDVGDEVETVDEGPPQVATQ